MKAVYKSTIGGIAGICGGDIRCGGPERTIETITTDSRDLGMKNLFIPLAGEKFDGHNFIDTLCRGKSIEAFLTMKDGYGGIARGNNVAEIKCGDTMRALGAIAASHRKNMNAEVIGITGTNGKTTVKELLYSLLKEKYPCHRNEKNYNNEIGVPFALLNLNEKHRMAIIEMGMNHPGEIGRLSMISTPDAAVITNIGEGHLEFLGSVENVAGAKCEIMKGMKEGSLIFINRDTECYDAAADAAREGGLAVRTFGLGENADVQPDRYRLFEDRIEIELQGETYSAPLYGIHNVYNILAAVSVAMEYGLKPAEIRRGLEGFRNIDGRSQVINRGYVIINDTYNSNPLSSRYALRSAGELFHDRRKIAVLSDMKELGPASESYHEATGREAAGNGFDYLLAWGDMAGAYARGAVDSGMDDKKAIVFQSKNDMIKFLLDNITGMDLILVKGSRSMKMEEVVQALLN